MSLGYICLYPPAVCTVQPSTSSTRKKWHPESDIVSWVFGRGHTAPRLVPYVGHVTYASLATQPSAVENASSLLHRRTGQLRVDHYRITRTASRAGDGATPYEPRTTDPPERMVTLLRACSRRPYKKRNIQLSAALHPARSAPQNCPSDRRQQPWSTSPSSREATRPSSRPTCSTRTRMRSRC